MKKIILIIELFLALILLSCKQVIENADKYVETLNFQNGSYTIYEEGLTVCYVQVSPTDSFDYYDVSFDIDNPLVCEIKRTETNCCVVYGKSKGSTILTAILNGVKCYTVINVKENI